MSQCNWVYGKPSQVGGTCCVLDLWHSGPHQDSDGNTDKRWHEGREHPKTKAARIAHEYRTYGGEWLGVWPW